ncbi:MAG: molybdate ABC transporter substrate-binding protein [Gammaproteobacteria bacterium]|nr:molybdate ABC transporter substrate-binding protein [Gammaproteobacteria bacterium]
MARLWLAMAFWLVAGSASATSPVRVAAASSLAFALPEIVAAYRAQGGGPVEVSYGSSGLLTRQIQRGAPFDLFLSADEGYVVSLARDGLARDEGRVYATGELVLYVHADAGLDPAMPLSELPGLYASGRLTRLALAHPEHAPYGIAAREALAASGVWRPLQPVLVIGENVAQAARFVTSGSAEVALLPRALAQRAEVAAHGRFAPLRPGLHSPLRQRMVLLRDARAGSEPFFAFLAGREARAILARHGFGTP